MLLNLVISFIYPRRKKSEVLFFFLRIQSGGAHSILGVIATLLACVQPIMTLLRPDPDAER